MLVSAAGPGVPIVFVFSRRIGRRVASVVAAVVAVAGEGAFALRSRAIFARPAGPVLMIFVLNPVRSSAVVLRE